MRDKRPHIYFRADASKDIGYGHFVRTLALADMVGDGFERTFVTRSPSVSQIEQIKAICDDFIKLGDDHFDAFLGIIEAGDIVVLDNYFFTTDYQRQIKTKGCKLVCIDDMHDKHYVADVVINHGLNDSTLFSVEPYTLLCLGLDWALVRKPFLDATPAPYHNREKGHCVVCFGGTDSNNLTEKVCKVLSSNSRVTRITAIVGDAYGCCDSLGGIGKVEILKNLSAQEMADLFCRVEFAVLPTSTVCIEALLCECPILGGYYVDNQVEYFENFSELGYIAPIGDFLCSDMLEKVVKSAPKQVLYPNTRLRGQNYRNIFTALLFDIIDYIDLTPEQSEKVWEARNLPEVRQFMTNSNPFDFESHEAFIEQLKTDKSKRYWAIFQNKALIGTYNVVGIANRCAERGLFISPPFWGKNYAKQIETIFDDILFKSVGLDLITAEVLKGNSRSLAYHKKMGYQIIKEDEMSFYLEKFLQ